MKATVNRKQLIAALQAAKLVVPTKFTLPVLGNVMLRAHDGQLTISATNLEQFIVRTIEGSKAGSKEAGAITLPLKMLSAMVSSMKSAEVTIEAEKDKAKITDWESGLAFPLAGLPAEEFPPEPGVGQCIVSSMSSAEMLRILNKVSFAASDEEKRYVLCGTFLKMAGQDAEWVATNGMHMVCAKTKMDQNVDPERGWIIPNAATKCLINLLKESNSMQVELSHIPATPGCSIEYVKAAIYSDEFTTWFVTKLIDGQYPNYKVVIPSEFKFSVDVGLDWLISTLGMAVKIVKDDDKPHVKLAIDTNGMSITIRYGTDNAAKFGKKDVKIDRMNPDDVCLPFAICFNARFMLDAVSRMEGRNGTVKFMLKDGSDPLVIVDAEHFYVLMPVREV